MNLSRGIARTAMALVLAAAAGLVAAEAPGPRFHAELVTTPSAVAAGQPAGLAFTVRAASGESVRFLQYVHEKPLHLLVVSEDLAEFAHIHPEMQPDDSYRVEHVFAHGGSYRLYADYTPPGSGAIVDRFAISVRGEPRPAVALVPDAGEPKSVEGLSARLSTDRPLGAGESIRLQFDLTDEATGAAVTDLQLYLGALAHFVVISEDLVDFIHAHPLEAGEVFDPSQDPSLHVHDPAQLAKQLVGPSPSSISAYIAFPRAGRYKLWAQFRRHDRVITIPFVLPVAPASDAADPGTIAAGEIRIEVGSSGYSPSKIEVDKGQPVRLAFHRADGRNCADVVVFPQLHITKPLPVGATVPVEFTPSEAGEISFTCGMGMFGGSIVVR